MKRKITLGFFAMILFLSHAQAQILTNGDFENWSTGPSGHPDPDGWMTNNADSIFVAQAAPRTGSYSCSLLPVADTAGGFLGGQISISYSGSVKPLVFSGWWKGVFNATPTDGITIDIIVIDTNFNISGTVTITTPSATDLPTWTHFSDSVNYTTTVPAYGTGISIALSANSPFTNGQLDDLTMTYLVGVDEIIEAHFPSAVLRPDEHALNHILYVDLLAPQSFQMNIFSTDGRKVYSRDFNLPGGHHEFSIPTENLSKGMYSFSVTGKGMQHAGKFIR